MGQNGLQQAVAWKWFLSIGSNELKEGFLLVLHQIVGLQHALLTQILRIDIDT